MRVRSREQPDEAAVERFLAENDSRRVARLGELVDALAHPALLAEQDGELLGVLTYVPGEQRWEVLTLHARVRRTGVGSALLAEVERIAAGRGAAGLFLITTNDNVDALRFYQRRGFELAELHRGSVDASRERFKPEIPRTGDYGIPLRDELVLEKRIAP